MTVRVFVQSKAGPTQKQYHEEKTLAHVRTASVAHAYPYLYGFIVGTDVMEQSEDGVDDHNVLARLPGEHVAGKQIAVGRFLNSTEAERHITLHRAA
jgi:hypothetical protein